MKRQLQFCAKINFQYSLLSARRSQSWTLILKLGASSLNAIGGFLDTYCSSFAMIRCLEMLRYWKKCTPKLAFIEFTACDERLKRERARLAKRRSRNESCCSQVCAKAGQVRSHLEKRCRKESLEILSIFENPQPPKLEKRRTNCKENFFKLINVILSYQTNYLFSLA
jgi:hypothetical protein